MEVGSSASAAQFHLWFEKMSAQARLVPVFWALLFPLGPSASVQQG
jgi:hypothetical protein